MDLVLRVSYRTLTKPHSQPQPQQVLLRLRNVAKLKLYETLSPISKSFSSSFPVYKCSFNEVKLSHPIANDTSGKKHLEKHTYQNAFEQGVFFGR